VVPSGVTSVLEATLPLLTLALEVFVLRRQTFSLSLLIAVALGFGGIGLMLFRNSGQQFAVLPCLVILGGSASWSLGSVLTRSLTLPSSRVLTAGAEMLLGGVGLLILSVASGELHSLHGVPAKAIWAVLYLIVAASLVAFTAYVWLLGRKSATLVSSHAYVNPIVAILLGHFLGGEVITARTLEGAAIVILSVALTLRPAK
jgi:drug/metabolite transporter (DMT)-like permease